MVSPPEILISNSGRIGQFGRTKWSARAEFTHDISESELQKQKNCKYVYLFVRKVESENGITLPHTYIGKGVLTNPRKTDGSNGTYIYDIKMENDLPEYLQYDFGLTKE